VSVPDDAQPAGRSSQLATLITAFTALGALVFTALSLQATREQIHVAEQGQITDRYTRAIDQLGTPGPEHLQVRLGGIFALERLAADSPRDRKTIIEVLTAFVRATSPRVPDTVCPPTPADVQAAFVVLGRRDLTDYVFRPGDPPAVDLRATCLAGILAPRSDLTGFTLGGADLTGANLYDMRFDVIGLNDTVLAGAILSESDFTELTYVEGADFTGAQLLGAKFGSVVLTDVTFAYADLSGADLGDAHFVRADLTRVLHNQTVTTRATHDEATTGAWWG
jgi:uncharacterized protein YjbI with pentapeptide repeats